MWGHQYWRILVVDFCRHPNNEVQSLKIVELHVLQFYSATYRGPLWCNGARMLGLHRVKSLLHHEVQQLDFSLAFCAVRLSCFLWLPQNKTNLKYIRKSWCICVKWNNCLYIESFCNWEGIWSCCWLVVRPVWNWVALSNETSPCMRQLPQAAEAPKVESPWAPCLSCCLHHRLGCQFPVRSHEILPKSREISQNLAGTCCCFVPPLHNLGKGCWGAGNVALATHHSGAALAISLQVAKQDTPHLPNTVLQKLLDYNS